MTLINPIIPGEVGLLVTRTECKKAVALAMGWDRDPAQWEADQTADFAIIEPEALRRVYGAHTWSFLSPTVPITLTAGTPTYDLPSDFASMEMPIVYTGNYAGHRPVLRSSMAMVTRDIQSGGATGVPTLYAIETLASGGESMGSRYALHFNCLPSSPFTMRCTYRINPYLVTDDRPYPLGGMNFASALRAAYQAEAETSLMPGGGDGRYAARLAEALATAIADDIRSGPTHLGTNSNHRRREDAPFASSPMFTGQVTYGGNPLQ